jgi:small subunit ribosomal protein S11
MTIKKDKKKSASRKVPVGVVHILAGFNNTIITVSDLAGNALCWSSSGKMKFRGAQRSTPFAAQTASEDVGKIAKDKYGMKTASVILEGPGAGRESAVRALYSVGLIITSIVDITPVVHNGCRPPKRRRV